MKYFFQEKVFLPLSGLLTGEHVAKELKFLMKSQYWTRKQLDDYQNEHLRIIIQHAYLNVPYYHDLFDRIGLKPRDIKTKEDLVKLPILTKDIIKKEGIERFISKNINSKEYTRHSSSGSTGEPFVFYVSKKADAMLRAYIIREWYWGGFRLGDKYIKMSQNPRNSRIKKIQDWITNNCYLATNPLVESNFKCILDKIEKFKPVVLRSYPDVLLFLAEYRIAHEKEYSHKPLFIATTGNTLFQDTRNKIEKIFGCKIFDSYSCDCVAELYEDESHSGYCFVDEFSIPEIVDEKDGIGRLVATQLLNYAMPLLRYDTQDLVERNDSYIGKRNYFTVKRILGRDNEVLTVPSGRRFIVHHFTTFFSQKEELKECINQFQVVKISQQEILFKLVVNDKYTDSVGRFIISFWEKEFGLKVKVEIVDFIPIMNNNKRKFIVNKEIDNN